MTRYWWVNQNQTYKQERSGGYIWAPKRKANGDRNPFYENMREVAPGDIVFSFCDTRIPAVGIITSYCYESPRPVEFGKAGANWEDVGWRAKVDYHPLDNSIRPQDHIAVIRPTLPERYSPLQSTGIGNRGIYLAAVPPGMALVLIDLIRAGRGRPRDFSPEAQVAFLIGALPAYKTFRNSLRVVQYRLPKQLRG